jgi:hypothetical protein
VRHTQLVLALPVVLAAILGSVGSPEARGDAPPALRRWPSAVLALLLFSGAALVAALPDIVYRWRVFGGPFAVETTELPLMGLQHIGLVAWQMVRDSLAAGEWGYLFPLALYGAYRLGRDRGREALVLGSAFLAVLLVHLAYRSLRLRDLISIFPLVDLAVAYGSLMLVQRVRGLFAAGGRAARLGVGTRRAPRLGAALLPAVAIGWVVLSLALSRWAMVKELWEPGWASFGYMSAAQRASFDRLAELTPPQGIIGTSLNAGAVMMYTGRDAIRPYDSWTRAEWEAFLAAMRAARRPVYLLDDGGLMAEFIEAEGRQRQLAPVEELEVPLFYAPGRQTGWLYRLEWEP